MNSTLTSSSAQLDLTSASLLLSQSFVMENWLVIPELNRLQNRLTDQCRAIEPRLMLLFCHLAANEFTVVSRNSLVEQLWPNVIVNENSLTRAVSELRKQLRGGCREDAIQTIPKRGYRLLCKIESIQNSTNHESPRAPKAHKTVNLAFLTKTMTSLFSMARIPKPALMAITMTALLATTFAIDSIGSLGSEPDGLIRIPTALVDEVVVNGPSYSSGLWGKGFALSSANNIKTGNKSATRPVVSHDGSSYAYLSYDQDGSTIFVGTLNEMSAPCAIYHDPERLLNLAWSPLGQSLLFSRKTKLTNAALFSNNQAESQLLVLNVASGELKRLVEDELPKNSLMINESSLT
ncbi:MAG: DNA-binding winged helix-turn-helix (wHTH) protein [Pseudohongiellaceae bacterium]|jgi:DNA-binding winged helix-turn-helix (wHTH) protein